MEGRAGAPHLRNERRLTRGHREALPRPAEHLRIVRHVTKRHDLMRLNTVAGRKLLQNPALIDVLGAHLDQGFTHHATRDGHERSYRLMHACLQDIRVHAGHADQVLNDRCGADTFECFDDVHFHHAGALEHLTALVRALDEDGIHSFQGVGGVGEHGLQQFVGAGNHRGVSTVDFFHLVRAQVEDHGAVGADSVGVEVGLLAQRREPAARAAGDENNLNSGGSGGLQGAQGARTETEVMPDEGAVQVAGDEFNHAVCCLRLMESRVMCGSVTVEATRLVPRR